MPFAIQSSHTKKWFVWGKINPVESWVDSLDNPAVEKRKRRKDMDLIAASFRGQGISCVVVNVRE